MTLKVYRVYPIILLFWWGFHPFSASSQVLSSDFGEGGVARYSDGHFNQVVQVTKIDSFVYVLTSQINTSTGLDYDMMLQRFDAQGQKDESWMDGGVGFDFPGYGYSFPKGFIRLEDSTVVIYGEGALAVSAFRSLAVLKLTENGALDSTFGTTGLIEHELSGVVQNSFEKMVSSASGFTALGNATYLAGNETFQVPFVIRFTEGFQRDSRFGGSGAVIMDYVRGFAEAKTEHTEGGRGSDVWVTDGDTVYVTAFGFFNLANQGFLTRILPDGTLDTQYQASSDNLVFPSTEGYGTGKIQLLPYENSFLVHHTYLNEDTTDFYVINIDENGIGNTWQMDFEGQYDEFQEAVILGERLISVGYSTYSANSGSSFYDSDEWALSVAGVTNLATLGTWSYAVDPGYQSGASDVCVWDDDHVIVAGFVDTDDANERDLVLVKVNLAYLTAVTPGEVKSGISFYPNPVQDLLFIEGVSDRGYLEIQDIQGRTLWKQDDLSISHGIDVSGFQRGVYTLLFEGESECLSTKFMKQ